MNSTHDIAVSMLAGLTDTQMSIAEQLCIDPAQFAERLKRGDAVTALAGLTDVQRRIAQTLGLDPATYAEHLNGMQAG